MLNSVYSNVKTQSSKTLSTDVPCESPSKTLSRSSSNVTYGSPIGESEKKERDVELPIDLLSALGFAPDLQRICEIVLRTGWQQLVWPHGVTALHLAAKHGSEEAVRLLLHATAAPALEQEDCEHSKPIDYARTKGFSHLFGLLDPSHADKLWNGVDSFEIGYYKNREHEASDESTDDGDGGKMLKIAGGESREELVSLAKSVARRCKRAERRFAEKSEQIKALADTARVESKLLEKSKANEHLLAEENSTLQKKLSDLQKMMKELEDSVVKHAEMNAKLSERSSANDQTNELMQKLAAVKAKFLELNSANEQMLAEAHRSRISDLEKLAKMAEATLLEQSRANEQMLAEEQEMIVSLTNQALDFFEKKIEALQGAPQPEAKFSGLVKNVDSLVKNVDPVAEKLSKRGFTVRQLLELCIKHDIDGATTTNDVVRDIVVRETEQTAISGRPASFMDAGGMGDIGQAAGTLVSHAWKSPFLTTVLNIVIDASGMSTFALARLVQEQEVKGTSTVDQNGHHGKENAKLRKTCSMWPLTKPAKELAQQLLDALGKRDRAQVEDPSLSKVYWLCIFAVDQHKAICGACFTCGISSKDELLQEFCKCNPPKRKFNPCSCGTLKTKKGDPDHEIDKFHEVVSLMPRGILVSLDEYMSCTRRVWVAAEIAQAMQKHNYVHLRAGCGFSTAICEQLTEVVIAANKGLGLDKSILPKIEDCEYTDLKDKEEIVRQIRNGVGCAALDMFLWTFTEMNFGICWRLSSDLLIGEALEAIERIEDLELDCTWMQQRSENPHLKAATEQGVTNLGMGKCFHKLRSLRRLAINFEAVVYQNCETGIPNLERFFDDCKSLTQLECLEINLSRTSIARTDFIERHVLEMSNLKAFSFNVEGCSQLQSVAGLMKEAFQMESIAAVRCNLENTSISEEEFHDIIDAHMNSNVNNAQVTDRNGDTQHLETTVNEDGSRDTTSKTFDKVGTEKASKKLRNQERKAKKKLTQAQKKREAGEKDARLRELEKTVTLHQDEREQHKRRVEELEQQQKVLEERMAVAQEKMAEARQAAFARAEKAAIEMMAGEGEAYLSAAFHAWNRYVGHSASARLQEIRLKEWEADSAQHREQAAELEALLKSHQATFDDHKKQHSSATAILEAELADLRGKHDSDQTRLSSLAKELEDAINEKDMHLREKQSQKAKIGELESLIETLQSGNDNHDRRHGQNRQKISELEQMLEDSQGKLSNNVKQLGTHKSQIADLERRIQEYEDETGANGLTIANLSKTVDFKDQHIERLQGSESEQVEKLRKQVDDLASQRDQLNQDVLSMKSTQMQLERANEGLRSDAEAEKNKVIALELDLQVARSESNDSAKGAQGELDSMRRNLQDAREELMQKLDDSQSALATSQETLLTSETLQKDAENAVERQNNQLKELQLKLSKSNETILQLREQLDERQEELQLKSSKSNEQITQLREQLEKSLSDNKGRKAEKKTTLFIPPTERPRSRSPTVGSEVLTRSRSNTRSTVFGEVVRKGMLGGEFLPDHKDPFVVKCRGACKTVGEALDSATTVHVMSVERQLEAMLVVRSAGRNVSSANLKAALENYAERQLILSEQKSCRSTVEAAIHDLQAKQAELDTHHHLSDQEMQEIRSRIKLDMEKCDMEMNLLNNPASIGELLPQYSALVNDLLDIHSNSCVDPDKIWDDGMSPMHHAANLGRRDLIEYLIEVDGGELLLGKADANGRTPLFYAAAKSQPLFDWLRERAKEYLQPRPDVSTVPASYMKLLEEIEKQGWQSVSWKDGHTLLHWAAKKGDMVDFCRYLISLEADPNARDIKGKTALDYAIDKNNQMVAAFLRERTSDV